MSSTKKRLTLALLLAALGALTAAPQGCSGIGRAGDRCNPNRFNVSDDCNGDLMCSTNSCGVSVCCPAVIDQNAPPECQPNQPDCVDGGAAGSAGAGGDNSGGAAGASGGASGVGGAGGNSAAGGT